MMNRRAPTYNKVAPKSTSDRIRNTPIKNYPESLQQRVFLFMFYEFVHLSTSVPMKTIILPAKRYLLHVFLSLKISNKFYNIFE